MAGAKKRCALCHARNPCRRLGGDLIGFLGADCKHIPGVGVMASMEIPGVVGLEGVFETHLYRQTGASEIIVCSKYFRSYESQEITLQNEM